MSNIKDKTGQKFGQLTAIKTVGKNKQGYFIWEMRCDCGNIINLPSDTLSRSAKNRACEECNNKRKTKDLQGIRFGKLVVISPAAKKDGRTAWFCNCDCGKENHIVGTNSLTTGNTKSCGCENLQNEDLTGQTFGRLKVLSKFNKGKYDHWYYLCRCSCNKETIAFGYQLKRKQINSCGCLRDELASKRASLMVRELNNRWRGGAAIDYDERKTKEYSWWRKACLERDQICQICSDDKDLHAHHIESFIDNPEKRYDPQNGVILCETCHTCFHIEHGYGDNTLAQYTDFKKSLGLLP